MRDEESLRVFNWIFLMVLVAPFLTIVFGWVGAIVCINLFDDDLAVFKGILVGLCGGGFFVYQRLLIKWRIKLSDRLLSACADDFYRYRADYIRGLIDDGADVQAKNKDGKTPLMLARSSEVIKVLRHKGATE